MTDAHLPQRADCELSIVTTLYRSAPFIREFHDRMTTVARAITDDYEIVYTDDGSPDDVLDIALELLERDDHVRVVELSRNFGHHKAFVAGLSEARGRRIFAIDVDLEEQPEWLVQFADELDRTDADVVFGIQRRRGGGPFKSLTGTAFYSIFNHMSGTRITPNACTVRLMRRDYVTSLLLLRDQNLFLAGNYAWTGFRQHGVLVDKKRRPTASTYSIRRMVQHTLNSITSFSSYPLKAICALGLTIAVAAVLVGLVIVVRKLADPAAIALGWPSLMVSVWFLGGIIIFINGLLGIYIAMIFEEAKGRPQFIVRAVYERNTNAAPRRSVVGEVGSRTERPSPAEA